MKQAFTNTTNVKTKGKPLHLKAKNKTQMPVCRYGVACMYKETCIYRHPVETATNKSSRICMAFVAGNCTFGDNCNNRHPSLEEVESYKNSLSKILCKHGYNCQTQGCLYSHPEAPKQRYNVHATSFVPAHIRAEMENIPKYSMKGSSAPSTTNKFNAKVKVPVELWVNDYERTENVYYIQDSMQKFKVVNQVYSNQRLRQALQSLRTRVIDLHFQTVNGCIEVLNAVIPRLQSLRKDTSVESMWIITGTGHHVAKNSHQRRGAGGESILLSTTKEYLISHSIPFKIGVDSSGKAGAVCIPLR